MDLDVDGLQVLAAHTYNDDKLVELLGPEDTHNCAPIVITVGHGGRLKPNYIPDRSKDSPHCSKGGLTSYSTISDLYTDEIGFALVSKIIKNFGKVPYLVFNQLHRCKLDVNRVKAVAAQDNPIAEEAWFAYHNFISQAQSLVKEQYGTAVGTNPSLGNDVEGVKGLLVDLHGYGGGIDWQRENGTIGSPPFIHWGYRIPATLLEENCLSNPPKCTFSHASWLPNQDLDSLIRGKYSLGSRFYSLFKTCEASTCKYDGAGLPSYEHPNPSITLSRNNRHWREKKDRRYFSGGYTMIQHEYLEWEERTGEFMMNTVQIELPKQLRIGDGTVENRACIHNDMAHALSIALMSFIYDVFKIPVDNDLLIENTNDDASHSRL